MSKASEWATRCRSIETASQEARAAKPEDCWLKDGGRSVTFMVENWYGEAKPVVKAKLPDNESIKPSVEDLLSLARWIIDTFEDKS